MKTGKIVIGIDQKVYFEYYELKDGMKVKAEITSKTCIIIELIIEKDGNKKRL